MDRVERVIAIHKGDMIMDRAGRVKPAKHNYAIDAERLATPDDIASAHRRAKVRELIAKHEERIRREDLRAPAWLSERELYEPVVRAPVPSNPVRITVKMLQAAPELWGPRMAPSKSVFGTTRGRLLWIQRMEREVWGTVFTTELPEYPELTEPASPAVASTSAAQKNPFWEGVQAGFRRDARFLSVVITIILCGIIFGSLLLWGVR